MRFSLVLFAFVATFFWNILAPFQLIASETNEDSDKDFARYRDFGHLSGFIGNYLSKPTSPVKMSTTAGSYKITFYWITRESESTGPKTEQILVIDSETQMESPIEVSKDFKEHLDREGTAILEDGRLINVIDRNEKYKYLDISTKYPTGLGCKSNSLTPFISVAVSDQNRELSFGSQIYIPDVKGTPLPDGGVHDGLFSVDDTGKGISEDQIDIFVFIKSNWLAFQKHLKTHTQRFFVYKVFEDDGKK